MRILFLEAPGGAILRGDPTTMLPSYPRLVLLCPRHGLKMLPSDGANPWLPLGMTEPNSAVVTPT